MEHAKIERINALARKQKSEGLTDEDRREQAALRQEYVAEIRASLGGTLESTVIVRPDGTREAVSERRRAHGTPAPMKKKDVESGDKK